jgi:hypothetical protein
MAFDELWPDISQDIPLTPVTQLGIALKLSFKLFCTFTSAEQDTGLYASHVTPPTLRCIVQLSAATHPTKANRFSILTIVVSTGCVGVKK